jgi:hypothetical protein
MTARAACGWPDKPKKMPDFTAASDSAVRADCLVGECVVCVFWVLDRDPIQSNWITV